MVDGPGPSPLLHQQHISFSQKKKKKIDRILKREREREREKHTNSMQKQKHMTEIQIRCWGIPCSYYVQGWNYKPRMARQFYVTKISSQLQDF